MTQLTKFRKTPSGPWLWPSSPNQSWCIKIQNTYLVNVPKWVHLVRSLDSKNQIKWLATCGFKWFVDPIELIYLIGCLGAGNGVGERHPILNSSNQSVRNITQYLSSLYVSWHKSTIVLCNFQIKIIFFDIFFLICQSMLNNDMPNRSLHQNVSDQQSNLDMLCFLSAHWFFVIPNFWTKLKYSLFCLEFCPDHLINPFNKRVQQRNVRCMKQSSQAIQGEGKSCTYLGLDEWLSNDISSAKR